MQNQFVKAVYLSDPDTYEDMMLHEHTPGHERYLQAARDYHEWEYQNDLNEAEDPDNYFDGSPNDQKTLEEFNDADHYRDVAISQDWSQFCIAEFHDYLHEDPDDAIGTIVYLLQPGNTHSTIGAAVCEYFEGSDETHISFTRLSRHTDWIGFSPILMAIDEFTAFVFQKPGTNDPAFFILTNNVPDTLKGQYSLPFPYGQASLLADIITGRAGAAVWVPWDGDHLHHPDIPIAGDPIAVPPFEAEDLYEQVPDLLFNTNLLFDVHAQTPIQAIPYHQMLTWPHTPDTRQYLDAHAALEDHVRQYNDGEANALKPIPFNQYTGLHHYLELYERADYAHWATYHLYLRPTSDDGQPTHQDVAAAAAESSSQATIGLTTYNPAHRAGKRPFDHIHVTRLSRHPDWMGMEPLLASLEGHQALVFEKQDTNEPDYVIIAPRAKAVPPELADPPFPTGQAAMLREIFSFHAIQSLWVPTDATFDPMAFISPP